MKNNLSKLLFILCLVAGTSCSQNNQEGMENTEDSTAPDTTATTDEVPASLQQH